MLKTQIAQGKGGRAILADSITMTTPEDAGAIVVCGSHGGSSSAAFALEVPLAAVFFNDAGVGKDRAGIVALDILQERGVAAGAVAHTSARIGDSATPGERRHFVSQSRSTRAWSQGRHAAQCRVERADRALTARQRTRHAITRFSVSSALERCRSEARCGIQRLAYVRPCARARRRDRHPGRAPICGPRAHRGSVLYAL